MINVILVYDNQGVTHNKDHIFWNGWRLFTPGNFLSSTCRNIQDHILRRAGSLVLKNKRKLADRHTPQESDMEPYSPLARLTVLDPGVPADLVMESQMLRRPFHVVLLPLGVPDQGNDLRNLYDVSPDSIRLDALIQEINR